MRNKFLRSLAAIALGVASIGAFSACDMVTVGSEGLEYALSEDGTSYTVIDIGACTDRNIVIPQKHERLPVTGIDARAFTSCDDFISVTVPDSVTFIGDSAFNDCDRLINVTIGNGVTELGYAVFAGCDRLTDVVIPDGVKKIDDRAFEGCSKLTNITIPDSVMRIGIKAFYDCSSLTSIVIPDSVMIIGGSAFYDCSSLTSIKFTGKVAKWRAMVKGDKWSYNVPATKVICSNGTGAL